MKRYFQISCHALIISAFFALALTGRLDAVSIVLFSVGVSVSVYRTARGMPPLLSSRGAFLLSCAYIVLFAVDSLLISRSFITATIHLVLCLELAKLYQEKTDKDYLYLIILSFLMILAASSLTIDMSFVMTLFLFLVALVSTLMSFDMYRSERQTASDTTEVAAPLGAMSLWATVWIIVTGIFLFMIIPRVGTGYFSRAAVPATLLSGFTDSVQLGTIGEVKLNTTVVMRARQISGTPFGVLKWRGIALDLFDGRNWYRTERRRSILRASSDDQYWVRPIENTGDRVRFEILQERLGTTALFGPYQIRAVSGRLQGVEVDTDESVYTRFQTARRVQYEVLSEIPIRSPLMPIAAADERLPSNIDAAKYLQLPKELDPRIAALAREITSRATSTFEKASLVEAHLKRNYRYSLRLDWTPGPQPVATFLFDAQSGHCEYFASSMAILLRSAGIPTRMVNGFLMGEYNPVGGDYIVRQSDAHSWVEVYIPGRGWIDFDPTPPDPNQREMNLAVQISHYIDAMELFWNTNVLIYDSETQMQLFRSAQDGIQSMQSSMRESSDRWVVKGQILSDYFAAKLRGLIETAWFWAGVVVLASGIALLNNRRFLRTRMQIWRLRQGRGGHVDSAVVEELFYQAAHLAEGRAQKRQAGETWREWIFALPDAGRRTVLQKALEVFERCKYGRVPASAADFTLLDKTIRELKES